MILCKYLLGWIGLPVLFFFTTIYLSWLVSNLGIITFGGVLDAKSAISGISLGYC